MIKRIFTKWQLWACLCAVFVIIAALQIHYNNNPVSVERRDYMTDQEFQRVNVGMSQDEFMKVQEAKPARDVEPLTNNVFMLQYKSKDTTAEYTFMLEESKDGKRTIVNKSADYHRDYTK